MGRFACFLMRLLFTVRSMNSCRQSVSVARSFPVPVGTLWGVAGHPARIAHAVAMLREFRAPIILDVGSPVVETHTILGWPQRYVGRITQYIPSVCWGMTSSPDSPGPCPLAHDVLFEFKTKGKNST